MAAPGKDTQGDERMRKLLAVLCIIGCIALYSSETHQPATTRPAKSPASDSQTVKTQEAKQEKPAAKAQDQPVEKPAKNWYQAGYSDGFQDAGKGIYQPKSERERLPYILRHGIQGTDRGHTGQKSQKLIR